MDYTDNQALLEATANMTSAEVEQYYKNTLAGEKNQEPVKPIEQEIEKEVETEEEHPVVEDPKKDKLEQKAKIFRSQARQWKETAEKEKAEKEELLRKLANGEVENDFSTQEQLIDKLVAEKLAKYNLSTAIDTDKRNFMESYPNEAKSIDEIEQIIEENPTLSYEQARILFLAVNKPEMIYDPAEDNRKQLMKQAAPGLSVSSQEKSMDNMTSDELVAWAKQQQKAGKLK